MVEEAVEHSHVGVHEPLPHDSDHQPGRRPRDDQQGAREPTADEPLVEEQGEAEPQPGRNENEAGRVRHSQPERVLELTRVEDPDVVVQPHPQRGAVEADLLEAVQDGLKRRAADKRQHDDRRRDREEGAQPAVGRRQLRAALPGHERMGDLGGRGVEVRVSRHHDLRSTRRARCFPGRPSHRRPGP